MLRGLAGQSGAGDTVLEIVWFTLLKVDQPTDIFYRIGSQLTQPLPAVTFASDPGGRLRPGLQLLGNNIHKLTANIQTYLCIKFSGAGWTGHVNFRNPVTDDIYSSE